MYIYGVVLVCNRVQEFQTENELSYLSENIIFSSLRELALYLKSTKLAIVTDIDSRNRADFAGAFVAIRRI